MAKKYYEGTDYTFDTDWGGDSSTSGLPLPGRAVQEVIKGSINDLNETKVGYIAKNDGTVYFSANKEAYENEEYIGSVVALQTHSMMVTGDTKNREVFLSSDKNKEYVWYFKSIEVATDTVYQESVTVEYHIENITDGVEKLFTTTIDSKPNDDYSGCTRVVMDLDEYLTNGVSTLEIVVKGVRTKQERLLQDKITIVTLDIEDKTDFSKPFDNRLIVNTNINCTLGQTYFYEYKLDEAEEFTFHNTPYEGDGRNILKEFPLYISDLSDGKHIFEYRIFINIGGESRYYTSTQRIEFIKGSAYHTAEPEVLLFSAYNEDEEHIASDGNLIINGATQYVPYQIKCAVYNSEVSTTNVEFYEIVGNEEFLTTTTVIAKGAFFNYSIQSMNSGVKTIRVVCKDVNGVIFNEEGRIFYIDVQSSTLNIKEYRDNLRIDFSSIGKDNSASKDTWESNIKESGFHNQATFNETFDWSQGWTTNGLVISEGCEVTFDYAPFPYHKDSPTAEEAKEFIGGEKGFSFEIEFMTQNVTDESAILCDMTNELSTNNCGLLITGSEIKFTTPGGSTVSSRFKEGDMNRVAIVINPYTTEKNEFKGLVELYVNGVMSSIAKYSSNENFEVFSRDETGNAVSKMLSFKGTAGADLVVKYIRTYNGVMAPDNVVNNYIVYRDNSTEMLELYNKNNVLNEQNVITPNSVLALGNIPILIFVGRTVESELATGCGNVNGYDGTNPDFPDGYLPGKVDANDVNWYGTLESTTNKKEKVDMDVIYYNPLDKTKNFKFVKAYITPQGTSSMYYPKKNYRIYTQKNDDTRMFLSRSKDDVLELDQMLIPNFGEKAEDRIYEVFRGTDKKIKKQKVYSFKDNAQAVKCWCLKADFAETSSSHNTGIARLWGDTLRNATVSLGNKEYNVFKTTAQSVIEKKYNNNVNGDMPDIRTTIDGFPIVVFGKKSYADEYVFLGKYNFNNDKSTESVFGFCDIDDKEPIEDKSFDYDNNVEGVVTHTLDKQLDQYMTCVETLDNGNALANFSTLDNWYVKDEDGKIGWEKAFEFRYPEIPEEPDAKDYQDENGNWKDKEGYDADLKEFKEETLPYWENTHLKPFKHFADWLYSTRWCDVHGNILPDLTEEEAALRKEKFAEEKWLHIDVWKMAAYYIYAMRFGAVDQIVKNSMLTSEGPFAYNREGNKYGEWDSTDVSSELYGKYYKWYYINYDNDTIMGVKNDGSLKYGPEITRQDLEGEGSNKTPIYAGYTSTLWNNIEYDVEFQDIIRAADRGISRTMTYNKAINMFEKEQVGKWCERIYNRDAEYKYINPYKADWSYKELGGEDENAENFSDKLFMLQGSRTAHRRWWLSRRFNLLDGRWSSGDFASKYIEVKCDYGSIGDTFTAIAGANAYFGYQINNITFGDAKGGVTKEYKANEQIDWELRKVINIGDPIAIYGSNDILELNLEGISKNLSSVMFRFGANADLGNKLERFYLSIPEKDLHSEASYKAYADDEVGTANRKSAFEKIKLDYPFDITSEADFEEGGLYPTTTETFDATDENSPRFYRVVTTDDYTTYYTYFAKITGGVRNYACNTMSFDVLEKLQSLRMAGYMSIKSLDLTKNKFINDVDVRYSSVSTVNFGDGSRIKLFKASDRLTSLTLKNSNNLIMSNIYINDNTLKSDGGRNINVINIDNSTGLNHDSADFKKFIIKWMSSGDISSKKLALRGIYWRGVEIEDLLTIKKFLLGDENGKHAIECIITGVIEMADTSIGMAELEMFNELIKALGGSITIKMPYDNVILNRSTTEIVAGEKVEYSYSLFPDAQTIIDGGGWVECNFLKEVTFAEGYDVKNGDKFYKIVDDGNELRQGIKLIEGDNNNFWLETEENVIGMDTNIGVAVTLHSKNTNKRDFAPLLIKEPTYAVRANINGLNYIGEKNSIYSYDLTVISNTDKEPIGTINIDWTIMGASSFLSGYSITNGGKKIEIATGEDLPYPTGEMIVRATITNHEASQDVVPPILSTVIVEKPVLLLNERVILTKDTNPVVFEICKEQGWVSDEFVMTREEAESITDIGTVFANVVSDTEWSFEEFRYFINANLTTLSDGAFSNSNIVSIVIPENITVIGKGTFENCPKLKNVQLHENITEIPERCFLNCIKLANFDLPDSVIEISRYAFGGAKMERIISKDSLYIDGNKAILISKDSSLKVIRNDAFETELWTPETTTNVLQEIYLPNNLFLSNDMCNFTLSKTLFNVVVMDEMVSNFKCRNGILYGDINESKIIRAIPMYSQYFETLSLDVTEIYDYAFYNCKNIKKIVIGDAIGKDDIGIGAFCNSDIEEVDLSACDNLSLLYPYTFKSCLKLHTVTFPQDESFEKLIQSVFCNCPLLTEITLPNTLVSFEGDANGGDAKTFYNCGLIELILPDSVISSGRYMVDSCPNLKKVVFSPFYKSVGSGGMDRIINCPALEEVVLPIFSHTVTKYSVTNGTDVIGIFDTIGSAEIALQDGYEIKEVEVDEIVNEYFETNHTPFADCPNIIKYVLNEKDNNKIYIASNNLLYKVGNVERNNSGTPIILPQDKQLGAVPFGLTEIIIDNDTKGIVGHCFNNCYKLTEINLPDGITELSQNSMLMVDGEDYTDPNKRNKNLVDKVTLPSSLTALTKNVFAGYVNLKEIIIPSGVTSIPTESFRYCENLKNVVLMGEITDIGTFAFNYCEKLESITIFAENAPSFPNAGTNYKGEVSTLPETAGIGDIYKMGNKYYEWKMEDKKLVWKETALHYKFHPFGYDVPYNDKYVGFSVPSSITKYLYLPYNYNDGNGYGGYHQDIWETPLLSSGFCNFDINYIKLNQEVIITAIDSNGEVITDGTLWFTSDSQELLFEEDNSIKTATYSVSDGGFRLDFNNQVAHNETITVYSDAELTNVIGTFVAKYNVNEYTVGSVVLSTPKTRSLFSTNLFGIGTTNSKKEEETVQITKTEYNMLISKINQLTEKINKIK